MQNNIQELPTQVTASLDDTDAEKWMQTYNREITPDADPSEIAKARRKAWESVKTAPSSFSFCIKASVEAIDRDKEVIDVDSIKKAMDSFIQYGGNVQNEHGNYNVGCIWGWDPITENKHPGVQVWGNIFGGDQVYDLARQAFIKGRNNLSVAGEASEGHFMCDSMGCYTRRNVSQLLEISLCDVPANPTATMLWYNKGAKMTKSASVQGGIGLNVDSQEIHKDYTACPIQALKKSLREQGYEDVHAKQDGVLAKISSKNLDEEYANLFWKGYKVTKVPEGLFIQSKLERSKATFMKARSEGWISRTGLVMPGVPKEVFEMLYDTCAIQKGEDGLYRFRSE